MKHSRIISIFLVVTMLLCTIPFNAFAADPAVVTVDGENTVFLGSFGKVMYQGKSYVSYKKFGDAVNAIAATGGNIVLSGIIAVSDFKDVPGRAPIKIIGAGSVASGNRLEFSGTAAISLTGPIAFENMVIKTEADTYIFTNGHSYTTANGFDTFYRAAYKDTPKTYVNPPHIAFGNISSDSFLVLTDARYASVTLGASKDYSTNANTLVTFDGASADLVVAGNTGSGTHNGNVTLSVMDGEFSKILAGSQGGTFNGTSVTNISGGNIDVLAIGSENGAVVNGNILVNITGGNIANINGSSSSVAGKKVIIVPSNITSKIASDAADYIVKVNSGKCTPKFDGNSVAGFLITDSIGIPAGSVTINGAVVTSSNGLYSLATGESVIEVAESAKIELNKNANYIKGYEDGSFRPQNNMTKAEAVTLLVRLLIDENIIKGNVTSSFLDVAPGSWYESYIGFFENLGYLDLLTENNGLSFAPDKNITRAQFTQLLYEISYKETEEASKKSKAFFDVASDSVFVPAVNYAASLGIITGYEDATFRPDNNISRAEVVTMVNRLVGRIPNGVAGANNFYDIAGHWANGQILASCNPENVSWTAKSADSDKYIISGTNAKDYITGLYQQGTSLSAQAIRDGVDVIAEQMKKDILNAPDSLDLTGKKVYYISEKNGKDSNSGLSPDSPKKTIAALPSFHSMENVAVLFERGGIYRGQINLSKDSYYGAYGDPNQPKPLLMQSRRNFADPSLWEETEYPNVYKATEQFKNVGVIGFDHDLFDYSESCYDETYGKLMNIGAFGFSGPQDLKEDLQFYSVIPNNDLEKYGDLYLYSEDGNPGKRFKSIEIGERINIIQGNPVNVIIENLAFKFTGAHGILAFDTKNLTVRNCVFSWIGGSVLSFDPNRSAPINYGNAIETGACDGFYLENNWAYQIYDTGLTHQTGNNKGSILQNNIKYHGNLLEYCHWCIEFYCKTDGATINDYRKTQNQHMAYNLSRLAGYGWGSIVSNRTTSAQMYHGSYFGETENLVTEYNIFDRSAGYLINLAANCNEIDDKNIYIQHLGNILGSLRGKMANFDSSAADNIVRQWGDKNALVIQIDPQKEPTVNLFK